ncbi:MAG: PHP domain-containing protein, partial [Deltaproteobacteria bacterium]|nr:PHP domain-containing protein [Deltaproteobacteria bacterium]
MYVELRAASAFTFLRAASQPEELADAAAAMGYQAMAIADADGVYGVPRFAKSARSLGIRPIVGATVALDPRCGTPGRVLLLCESAAGWRNLCELLTEAHRGREKGEAFATPGQLERFRDGLVAIAGGADGPVLSAARGGDGLPGGEQSAGKYADGPVPPAARGGDGLSGGEPRDGERRGGERSGGKHADGPVPPAARGGDGLSDGERSGSERSGGERRDGERRDGERRDGERRGGERSGGKHADGPVPPAAP